MAVGKRKCPHCGEYNRPDDGVLINNRLYCDISHATAYGIKNKPKGKAVIQKAENKRIRKRKQELKTATQWLDELQTIVNKIVRLRDKHLGCISCDKPSTWGGQWHAGHFYPRGRCGAIRFNLWNIHKQCSVCNNHLSGNLTACKPRLIEKIGIDRFNYLELHQNDIKKWDIDYIKKGIRVAKKALKRIEKIKT